MEKNEIRNGVMENKENRVFGVWECESFREGEGSAIGFSEIFQISDMVPLHCQQTADGQARAAEQISPLAGDDSDLFSKRRIKHNIGCDQIEM